MLLQVNKAIIAESKHIVLDLERFLTIEGVWGIRP